MSIFDANIGYDDLLLEWYKAHVTDADGCLIDWDSYLYKYPGSKSREVVVKNGVVIPSSLQETLPHWRSQLQSPLFRTRINKIIAFESSSALCLNEPLPKGMKFSRWGYMRVYTDLEEFDINGLPSHIYKGFEIIGPNLKKLTNSSIKFISCAKGMNPAIENPWLSINAPHLQALDLGPLTVIDSLILNAEYLTELKHNIQKLNTLESCKSTFIKLVQKAMQDEGVEVNAPHYIHPAALQTLLSSYLHLDANGYTHH